MINITQIDTSSTWQNTSVPTEIVLSVHPFYRYSFVIAAVTVHEGPYSEHIVIEMPEDGRSVPSFSITIITCCTLL